MSDQLHDALAFDLDDAAALPDLHTLVPEHGGLEALHQHLETTYVDTPSANLARLGVTLARHSGEAGGEAWTLQVLGDDLPVDAGDAAPTDELPVGLARLVTGVRAGETVARAARVEVARTRHRITADTGAEVLTITDDRAQGTAAHDPSPTRTWRRLTLQLGPAGGSKLRRRAVEALREAGARPAAPVSDLQRTLGPAGHPGTPSDPDTVGGLASAYVAAQFHEIVRCDLGLRLDQPLVHKFRVAIRRLRSTLRVFAPLFEAEAAAELETELVWLAGLLGEVRDREVLMERLAQQLQDVPPEVVLGSVAAHIETTLLLERAQHRSRVAEAMDSDRYQALVQTLLRWITQPPLTRRAAKPVTNAARYVRRAEQKVDRRLAQAGGDVEALHGARKAAKRYRYAAELTAAVGGRRAARIVKSTTELQTLLGEHQDSVVSAEFLRRMGAEAGAGSDQNGFTYGFLLAQEWQRAQRLRDEAAQRWGRTKT